MSVIIETSVGDITIDLLIKERSKCCYNFLKLCKLKYYNLCGFHQLEKDFIAQTGDPTGTGNGGESIFSFLGESKFFPREMVPKVGHTRLGTVSMVNNGDDMHSSQFFITLRENLDYLDGIHTVFGYVVEGLETLDKMNELFFSDIIITHTIILADPFDDHPDLIAKYPDSSPEPSEEIISRMCIVHGIDEKPAIDLKEQESKAAATILEMIGDLPSEDVKPPDNVLFVCKLNSVTKEEDLHAIFTRFGPITECEIIRDPVTGDSLQYAFIEFENVDDCEKAYFKMDNVLIDDRRIHVDFSQSVAKFKWHRKSDKRQINQRHGALRKDGSPEAKTRKHETTRYESSSRNQRRDQKDYIEERPRYKEYSKHDHRVSYRDRDRNHDRDKDRRTVDYHKKDRESHRSDWRYEKEEKVKRRDRSRSRSRDRHRDRDARDRSYRKDRDYKRSDPETLRHRDRDREKSRRH